MPFVTFDLSRGCGDAEKAAMFEAIALDLGARGVRRDDVFVALTETSARYWYAGTR